MHMFLCFVLFWFKNAGGVAQIIWLLSHTLAFFVCLNKYIHHIFHNYTKNRPDGTQIGGITVGNYISGRWRGKPKLILSGQVQVSWRCFVPTVIDALFQRCTEGEGRVTKAVKGAGRVLTPPVLTVRGVLALIHICKGHHRHWLQ